MKKLFSFIFITFLFFISVVAFFPKDKLYYLLQKELLVHDVSINSQKIASAPFSIGTDNTYVYLSGSKVINIGKVHISLLGINIKNIKAIKKINQRLITK